MQLSGKRVVITGAASGIGLALAVRFAQEKAAKILVSDLAVNQAALDKLVTELSSTTTQVIALAGDVGQEADVKALADKANEAFGGIDLFVSNAGLIRDGDEHAPDAEWTLNWQVHLMSHVYAARAVVPAMIAQGGGYLLNTASAAGLLTSLSSATYGVTKHSAVALAEYLSIRHGNDGIKVSVLCPQAVDTPLIHQRNGAVSAAAGDGVISVEDLAESVVQGINKEAFLILPHPEVYQYFARKGMDYDRWLGGMRRFAGKLGFIKPQ